MTNARQFQVQRGYREEAGETGDTGQAADRGDDLQQAAADADAEAKKAEEAKAAEAKKAEEAKAAEEAERKRAAEKAEREKGVQIPKERFDAAVQKERLRAEASEKRAKELEEQLAARASAVDVKKIEGELEALEEQLDKALADNNAEEKKRLRRAIREKGDQLIDARSDAKAAAATAIAVEQIRYDRVVEQMEADYPFLNPDEKDTFDAELAGDIMELKTAYEAAGLGSTAALAKAAKTLKSRLDAKKAEGKKGGEEADAAAAKKAEEAEAKRKAEATAKGLEAKGQQPPNAAEAGRTDTKAADIKVAELSDEAFEKLPEAEKKRLRGD